MSLRKLKLFKVIQTGSVEAILKGLMDYLQSGKDPNIRDEVTGGTLLHLIVEHGDKFLTGQTVSGVYMLVCKDIHIDAQDNKGETALHKAMMIHGAFRIILALLRCGADTSPENSDGLTAEGLLLQRKLDGWEENLFWYRKFHPGLWLALSCPNPDKKLVERLLKNWCRVTTVKDGKVTSMKFLVENDIHKRDILALLEKYENTNELALATTAGMGFIIRMWVKQGIINNMDVNTKDCSYQYKHRDYPEAPRPLLAASWESGNLDAVNAIMELKPDTRTLWSPEYESKNRPKPVFFQLFCGVGGPYNDKIVERVLKGSDLTARDHDGNTILHIAILKDQSDSIVKFLLASDVDIAARDALGRTARQLALRCDKVKYTKLIDDFVIKLVKEKRQEYIEKLILQNYDHLLDIKDSPRTLLDVAKKYSSRVVCEKLKAASDTKAYVHTVFQAVDNGQLDELKKLFHGTRMFSDVRHLRDRCGRTLLHRALLKQRTDTALYIIETFPDTINARDSLDRTSLHYANLFTDNLDVLNQMARRGAEPALFDAFGNKASDYKREVMGNHRFSQLRKEVKDFDLNVYLYETDFENSFKQAILKGDLGSVKELVSGLKMFDGDVSRFSTTLFDCIDSKRPEIAEYLILNGFSTDVYRQYNKCNPSDPMCAMMECGHSMTSLMERAKELRLDDITRIIDAATNGRLASPNQRA